MENCTLKEAVSKLANAASRPRQLKLAPTLGQQVVDIGFSRCVREAQVFLGLLKPSECRFREGFLYQGYAKTAYLWH